MIFNHHLLGWLNVISILSLLFSWETLLCLRYSLPIIGIGPYHPKCKNATHTNNSASSKVSHCCSWEWFRIILYIPLPLTGWLGFVSGVPILLTVVALSHHRCFTGNHLGLFCVIPGVPLLLTGVSQYHFRCQTANHQNGSV